MSALLPGTYFKHEHVYVCVGMHVYAVVYISTLQHKSATHIPTYTHLYKLISAADSIHCSQCCTLCSPSPLAHYHRTLHLSCSCGLK